MVKLEQKQVMKELEIKLMDGETPDMLKSKIDESMKENIFPEVDEAGVIHKFFQRLFAKSMTACNWMLMRTSPNTRRWFWFHVYLKEKLLHRALSVFRWIFKDTLITDIDEIPKKPWNNIIRIWRYNCEESIFDIWRVWHTKQLLRNPARSVEEKEYYKQMDRKKDLLDTNHRSYTARKTYLDFETTMVIMDTADRVRVEMEMLRNCHSMMEMYGISEEERDKVPRYDRYPLYLAGSGKDPEYFLKFRNVDIWEPKEDKKDEKLKTEESRTDTRREEETDERDDKKGEEVQDE